LLSAILRGAGIQKALSLGVTPDLFLRRKAEWMYLEANRGVSRATFKSRFPNAKLYKVNPDEITTIVQQVQQNRLNHELGQIFLKNQRELGKIDPASLASRMERQLGEALIKFTRGKDINVIKEPGIIVDYVRQKSIARKEGGTVGYPFGIPTLDEIMSGMQPPHLITILARQGEYKTWLALYFATMAMMSGAKVLYTSLEMSPQEITLRIHTLLSKMLASSYSKKFKRVFSNMGLMLGAVNLKEYREFVKHARKYVKQGIIIPDIHGGFDMDRMAAKVEEIKPDIAFFDYFGLGISDNSKGDNWIVSQAASRKAKRIAIEHNIPFILCAQANRQSAESKEGPELHQASLTDAIGQDSDKVFSLRYRRSELILYVRKNRQGPMNQVIRFNIDIDKGVLEEASNRRSRYIDEEEEE
jgi:replicative DNA helicase